jgi:outer membrane murein-binding lipoprotein Lpp
MHWFRRIWALLTRLSPAAAQRRVDTIDRTLAELRAKVRALPPEQRAAFAKEIQAMVDEQARARNALSDALDDRHER